MWLADVHRTQISKYERGEIEPRAEVLARLSRALGVSAEEFFSGIGWQRLPPRLVIGSSAEDGALSQPPPSSSASRAAPDRRSRTRTGLVAQTTVACKSTPSTPQVRTT